MKVSIDPDRCQGHARCWAIEPKVFDLDDEGLGIVLQEDVPPELEETARKAVRSCPERAITLT